MESLLAEFKAAGFSARVIHNKGEYFRSFWRWLAERGHVSCFPATTSRKGPLPPLPSDEFSDALEGYLADMKSSRHYKRTFDQFAAWLDRPPRFSDLTEDNLSRFIKSLEKAGYRDRGGKRAYFHSFWQWCARQGLAESPEERRGTWQHGMIYPPLPKGDVLDALNRYIESSAHMSPKTANRYGIAIRQFATFLGRPLKFEDFNDDDIVRFMRHRREAGSLSRRSTGR